MIRKPGEVDRSTIAGTARISRKISETSPDDTIRNLQKQVASNKKCADCSAKLPQAVNLTHGTFVCPVCAGLHREFSHRIKGIGHSSFTAEEADFVAAHGGNDQVNSVFLFHYDASRDRMHAPDATYGDVDPVLLRTWLRRKYVEKAWYKVETSLEEKLGHSLKIAAAGDPTTSNVGTKATIVKLPPKASTAPVAASNDFFLDNNVGQVSSSQNPSVVVAPVVDSWDAFGSKGNQFDATFGTSVSPTVAQSNVHTQVPQDALFQADFDNLNMHTVATTVSHQTSVNVDRCTTFQANFTDLNPLTTIHTVNSSTPSNQPYFLESSQIITPHNPTEPKNTTYSMYAEVNQPHVVVGASAQNLGYNKSPERAPVDPIGTAFDSLVSPMTMGTQLHAPSGSDEIHEINALLQRCTKQQLHHVLQYLTGLLSIEKQLVPQSNASNGQSVVKKGNPFDF